MIMKIRNSILLITFVLATVIYSACKVGYSFTGTSIAPNVKTFSVYDFPNRARLVNPNLRQSFIDGLQDKLIKQTSLNQIRENGDLEFSGQITEYDIKPMNIQQGDLAALNRLTISVKVKYVNNKEHTQDWDKSFTAYEDFESSQSLSNVEDDLVTQIVVKLTDDIFNASIANW